MLFVNKQDREEVIELIYSGTGFCIIIDQTVTLNSKDKQPIGRILKYGKKELKKHYKKIKRDNKVVKLEPISEEIKQEIINTFDTDKIGIMQYTEDYVENSKYLDRQEEIKKQSEADRKRMIKTLADDYNPNGVKLKEDI